jgi:hypothetical protein
LYSSSQFRDVGRYPSGEYAYQLCGYLAPFLGLQLKACES